MEIGIMYPIYKVFNDRIFDDFKINFQDSFGTGKTVMCRKSFEFRTKLPKELKTGTKVYIYEPAKRSGCKKVVGEFTVGRIMLCDYPIGSYPFMAYFCRNILENEDYAQKFEKALSLDLPNYKKGTPINFALDKEDIEFIEQTKQYPPIFKEDWKKREETKKIIKWCDDWLMQLGFYNEWCESNYNYALEIINPLNYHSLICRGKFKKWIPTFTQWV